MEGIEKSLEDRKEKNLFRILRPARIRKEGKIFFKDKEYIDFSSNDYLGLSGHSKIKEAAKNAVEAFGASSSASRLLSGSLDLHHQLENEIALLKGKESALVFNSGYQANVGIISAICGRGDVVFSDRLNHASILDGVSLSGAKLFRFKHNDTSHLEELLNDQRRKFKKALVISETVFSMDGDKCPLKKIAKLKDKYKFSIMVDEAHATGIFGKKGSGLVEEELVTDSIDLIMGTFSKALGSFGAYVACSKELRDYLINFSRSFIYSTALPPAVISSNLASLILLKEESFRRTELLKNSHYFRRELKKKGFNIKGKSQIVPLIVGNSENTVQLSQELQERGYWVLPIRPPTVPLGESRLRFSLTHYHTKEILKKLIKDICQILGSTQS